MNTESHMNLETRNAIERTLRSAHFCWIVGESGDLVATLCRNIAEDVTSQLHTVARVSRKAYYDALTEKNVGFV